MAKKSTAAARATGQWSEAAIRVFNERYVKKDAQGTPTETPDELIWRVAAAVAEAEGNYVLMGKSVRTQVNTYAEKFYELMISRRFLPNSPTLMNAGKGNNLQLSACYVVPVEDTLEGIFDSVKHAALIHQSGGGTGMSFSRLRPKGSRVGSTSGVASGPVSFMKIFDGATEAVKQGGSRRGANMGILRVDHPDIREFINCKRDGSVTNFNISVAITNTFMDAFQQGDDYALVDPQTQEITAWVSAREIMNEIIDAAWATGDPGLVFLDRANAGKPNPTPELELIESTNPCGEQFLPAWDACNLGSLNLGLYWDDARRSLDWQRLADDTRLAVRLLDDVIDINPYPLPQVKEKVLANRRIGLGVMGWADLLFKAGIPYDAPEALTLADKVMDCIQVQAEAATMDLALERGPFPRWAQSIYRDRQPRRNCTLTTVAPTGSISILADCSSGIEPLFALAFQHRVKQPEGDYRVLSFINPLFLAAVQRRRPNETETILSYVEQHGTLHDSIYAQVFPEFVTSHEVAPEAHIAMQAVWQRHVDNAVSKTINLPNSATKTDIEDAYLQAWHSNCLGITVFRDGCKGEQVLNLGTKASEAPAAVEASEEVEVQLAVKPRPPVLLGYTQQIRAPEGKVNVTLNSDEEGLCEVFINIGKAGSDLEGLAEAMGRLISLTLRLNSPVTQDARAHEIARQLRHIGGSSSIGFGPQQVRSMSDAVAQAISKYLEAAQVVDEVGPGLRKDPGYTHEAALVMQRGDLCPDCGNVTLRWEEGCKKCGSCGYSAC